MEQEEQTCIENSLVYINAGWLLVVSDKKSYKFRHSFPLPVKIMHILHNDESLCFLKPGVPLNSKLETSPNISNLTFLWPTHVHYERSLPTMAFCEFFKTRADLYKGIACV
jgi:hypothetical protein